MYVCVCVCVCVCVYVLHSSTVRGLAKGIGRRGGLVNLNKRIGAVLVQRRYGNMM